MTAAHGTPRPAAAQTGAVWLPAADPALDQIEQARRVCGRCLARTPCLGWALDHGMVSGIWGGTTEEERRAMRRALAGR